MRLIRPQAECCAFAACLLRGSYWVQAGEWKLAAHVLAAMPQTSVSPNIAGSLV